MESELNRPDNFQALYAGNYLKLVQFAFLYVRDWEEAEDIVQEVFVQWWEKREDIRTPGTARAFLYLCVKTRCLNHLRHQRVAELYLEHLSRGNFAENPSSGEDRLLTLLQELPARQKYILELLYFQSCSYREVAQCLQLPFNTVKDHVKKAYAFLRQEMVRF